MGSSSLSYPEIRPETRNVKQVPFVELFDGCLQGVVSSGSDIQRVYISYFEARTLNFYCSTNNNRPCGGLVGPCNHLKNLLSEAVKQYGLEATAQYLQINADPGQITKEQDILRHAGRVTGVAAGEIFSRFLAYLHLLEHPVSASPLPEMDWFVAGRLS